MSRFVQRDAGGLVTGHYANPQPGYAEEELPDGHPDILAYDSPPPSAAQIAQEAERDLQIQWRAEIKAEAFVAQFIAMTPADVDAYVTTTVTDLASARTLLRRMAKMLLLLARREFRNGT
jgi:hypothetical protein